MTVDAPAGRSLLLASRAYERPSFSRAAAQLVSALAGLFLTWSAMFLSLSGPAWLTLALSLPAAGFLLRLFMLQHDCSHHSLLPTPRANDRLGRALSILTLTPYDYWRAAHSYHHAAPGNLTKRGVGDILTLTVSEYRELSRRRRFLYRLYRNPLFLFCIAAPILFLVYYRAPRLLGHRSRQIFRDCQLTNAGLACLLAGGAYILGSSALLALYLPPVIVASAAGAWMFFVQHQFENTYWAPEENWDYFAGALRGSSNLQLPKLANWFTGDIALHHIHHLNSRIPNYRLREFASTHPVLMEINRVSWIEGLRACGLALWDENERRLVSFKRATHPPRTPIH